MTPYLSSHDAPDRSLGHAVLSCEVNAAFAGASSLLDFSHEFGGEARRMLILPPLLPSHIELVVSDGAEEEVVRSNTPSHVTSVQHPEAIRYRAVRQFPRNPVGRNMPPTSTSQTDLSIPLVGKTRVPQPTPIGVNVNLAPKAFSEGATFSGHIEPPCSVAVPPEFTLAGAYSQHSTSSGASTKMSAVNRSGGAPNIRGGRTGDAS